MGATVEQSRHTHYNTTNNIAAPKTVPNLHPVLFSRPYILRPDYTHKLFASWQRNSINNTNR